MIRDYQFMISDPKIYAKVLSSTTNCSEKNVMYNFLKPWLRNGLIVSSGQYHKSHRKMMEPAFHFQILEQFVQIFDQQCNVLIDNLMDRADGSAIEIVQYLNLYALDTITETAMGTKINAQRHSNSDYVNAVERYGLEDGLEFGFWTFSFNFNFFFLSPFR